MTTSWYALCIDVNDVEAMAPFWAGATGLTPGAVGDGGMLELAGGPDGSAIVLCPVPEPVTVKQRVHVDVGAGSVAEVEALGAALVDDSFTWTVMTDPEGGELCVFVLDEPRDYRVLEINVDAVDAASIAAWWAERFGVEVRQGEGYLWLGDVPGMAFKAIVFCDVPEPKTVKNRIHWDVRGDVDELVAAGARVLRELPEWTVLTDPEGNEFCVFPPA